MYLRSGVPKSRPLPESAEHTILENTRVELAARPDLARINRLLDKHHYLGAVQPVGQRLYYLATDQQGQWLAINASLEALVCERYLKITFDSAERR
jgi:hypothetical protein